MSMTFWYKELVSNPFIVRGAAVPFEPLDGNRGVLAVDDAKNPTLVAELSAAAQKGRGGIVKLSQDKFEEVKKKHPLRPFGKKRPDMLQLMRSTAAPIFKPKLADAKEVAVAAKPLAPPTGALFAKPDSGEKPSFKPAMGKASQKAPAPAPTPSEPAEAT